MSDPSYNHTRGDSFLYPCKLCRGGLLDRLVRWAVLRGWLLP